MHEHFSRKEKFCIFTSSPWGLANKEPQITQTEAESKFFCFLDGAGRRVSPLNSFHLVEDASLVLGRDKGDKSEA